VKKKRTYQGGHEYWLKRGDDDDDIVDILFMWSFQFVGKIVDMTDM